MARFACLLARDAQFDLRTADGLPKIDIQSVFEIGSTLGVSGLTGTGRTAAAEKLTENIPEAAGCPLFFFEARHGPTALLALLLLAEKLGKVKTLKIRAAWGPGTSVPAIGRNVVRIETELVVNLLLVVVAQNVVSFLNLFEAFFGRFIAGVQVWVKLARELAVRLAYLVRVRSTSHSESFVIILFRC